MGRIQMETRLPYPPQQAQPQTQTQTQTSSNPLPQQPLHQLVVHPNYNHNHITALQPLTQNTLAISPNNSVLTRPCQTSIQNNAIIGTPLQVHYAMAPSPRVNNAKVGMEPWTTGLFDCVEDPTNAFVTALFPCVTFGQIADVLDSGNTTCATSGIIYAFSPCMLSHGYRRKLRQRYGLIEAPATDRLTHSFFESCALCQEYRELNNRGLNPALGWHGNVSNHRSQQHQSKMVPPKNQIMN